MKNVTHANGKATATMSNGAAAPSAPLTTNEIVATAIINSECALETARKFLGKMIAAHVLVVADPEYFAEDASLMDFAEDAAKASSHVDCCKHYFDDMRTALGIVKKSNDDATAVAS